jgi:hypothetical protein
MNIRTARRMTYGVAALVLAVLTGCANDAVHGETDADSTPSQDVSPEPPPTSTSGTSVSISAASASASTSSTVLPIRVPPGPRASPAGEYGWQGGPTSATPEGMHWVVPDPETTWREVAAIFFAVGPRCLAASEHQQTVPVSIAGMEGVSIERYQPPMTFVDSGDEITRGHALLVGEQTLCVFLTWHPSTSDGELATADAILETIKAEPIGERVRVTFTLPQGWDTG